MFVLPRRAWPRGAWKHGHRCRSDATVRPRWCGTPPNAYEVEYKTTIVTDENGNLITQNVAEDKRAIGEDNKACHVSICWSKVQGLCLRRHSWWLPVNMVFRAKSASKDKADTQVAVNGLCFHCP